MKVIFILLLAIGVSAPMLRAQSNAELLQRLQVMEERLRSVEEELRQLKGQPAGQAAVVSAPVGGAPASAAKVFNPDMAVIGNFIGAAGNGGPNASPSIEMKESEISLSAVIDPYARADFFLSFGQTGVDLEEGYFTLPALKGGFQLRAGKMRAAVGKVNTFHSHSLSWIDRPLVTKNFLGGEEGISDSGVSLSRLIPAPGGLFLEGTAQVYRGESEGVFQAWRRNDVSGVGRLRAYRDVNESTNVDVGYSYARGHSPAGPEVINQFHVFDGTVRWKPLRRSIYRSFIGRSEFVLSPLDKSVGGKSPFGYYLSGDYQLGRRWYAGVRYDRSERADSALLRDTGGSILLTYTPSEFSRFRTQLRRTTYAERWTANELLFQFQFSIGVHGAHPF
jgi:hypothetical protein